MNDEKNQEIMDRSIAVEHTVLVENSSGDHGTCGVREYVYLLLQVVYFTFKIKILRLKTRYLLFERRILLFERRILNFKLSVLSLKNRHLLFQQRNMISENTRRPMLADPILNCREWIHIFALLFGKTTTTI